MRRIISMKTSVNIQKEAELLLFTISIIVLAALWFGNGGAYVKMIRQIITPPIQNKIATPRNNVAEDRAIGETITTLSKIATPQTRSVKSALPQTSAYRITIQRVGITAPVFIAKNTDKTEILATLKRGVGIHPAASRPGEPGRTIILGHSARPFAFTLLETVAAGDRITIAANNAQYQYEVFDTTIVSPQVADAILAGPLGAESELTLITCWPTGNRQKRVVVRAKLIKPAAEAL